MSATYRKAGVDIAAADHAIAKLAPVIRATHGPEVLPDRGQFAALFRFAVHRYRDPVLVSSTDGVGTKLKLAQQCGAHAGIGVDVVAMNTNDILAYGAQPLFFLDYVAMGKISPRILSALIRGIARGCAMSGCALVGGETAEMPGVYGPQEYDVAGFCVGVVERARLIDGSRVRAGDVVVGLASSGVHANGFSLVRAVLGPAQMRRFKRQLLAPTRIYVKPVLAAASRYRVSAIAHVTGGGLARRLPGLVAKQPRLRVRWTRGSWRTPAIFQRIQEAGRIAREEMDATFNMGIGMALTCRPREARAVVQFLARRGVPAWIIGRIERSTA
ncbi:MAG: phosphoribosylformylglycinamidine cyclo-ligase [Candidatus Omnitrophica bacterium]|nr:phosphoribosylformylglycinamidine cyclo-ligase [Candidatus Omnitrophota bacterium]